MNASSDVLELEKSQDYEPIVHRCCADCAPNVGDVATSLCGVEVRKRRPLSEVPDPNCVVCNDLAENWWASEHYAEHLRGRGL